MPNIVEGSANLTASADMEEKKNIQRIRNNSSKLTAQAGVNDDDDDKEKIIIYVRR